MTEKRDLKSRPAIGRKRDGRREFDEDAIEELVQLCLKPGVSIARTAMDHDVNPNQLRRWITRYQQREGIQASAVQETDVVDGVSIDMVSTAMRVTGAPQPVFVPVVAAASATVSTPSPLSMTLALHVRLSNGVELELGKAIATIDELTTLVKILGRMPCSGSTTP
ncbi:transposase [Burkholderia multivorans]|uniref:transposase n=1 Tax=Burkholderia multivorans TaxID=87883 RepID=UPI001C256B7C|nr:transposase [Burkholderia multivorans]MBU9337255.1 transposase [Burkholderia multivorans]MCA8480110.1 transposase [Burkholderia multivorans]